MNRALYNCTLGLYKSGGILVQYFGERISNMQNHSFSVAGTKDYTE